MPEFVSIFMGLKSGLGPSPCSKQKSEYPHHQSRSAPSSTSVARVQIPPIVAWKAVITLDHSAFRGQTPFLAGFVTLRRVWKVIIVMVASIIIYPGNGPIQFALKVKVNIQCTELRKILSYCMVLRMHVHGVTIIPKEISGSYCIVVDLAFCVFTQ